MNRIELQLFRRERSTRWNHGREVPAVEIDPLNHPVVGSGLSHDGPIDVATVCIDGDAVRDAGAPGDQDLDI